MCGKTFIHHDGALGDLLLSLPAVELIRSSSGHIHMAGRADVAGLLGKAGYIHGASPADSSLFLSLYTLAPDERITKFLAGFDRAFIFTGKSDSVLAGNIGKIIPDTQIVLTIPPEGVRMHVSEFRLRQLADGRGDAQPVDRQAGPLLEIPSLYKEKAKQLLSERGYRSAGMPLVALHTGSGGKRKCWPLENFFELTERFAQKFNPFFIIISGPAEERAMRGKIDEFVNRRKGIVHIHNEELIAVAAFLSIGSLYIGNDSGITHLASAVNEKVAAIFGPTDPLLWKPSGRRVSVVSPDTGCAPCESGITGSFSGSFPACGRRCLPDISVERVYERSAYLMQPE
ncbi:MAG: glycosyltransferase family 9 protein [Nitrospirae bacterium]|nr:glycosyltransferase family 9 protein [Nitrospirota bacterium]MCL5237931.1 glycosyltransferase family 9 protein [Nitrospirota bacterium]